MNVGSSANECWEFGKKSRCAATTFLFVAKGRNKRHPDQSEDRLSSRSFRKYLYLSRMGFPRCSARAAAVLSLA